MKIYKDFEIGNQYGGLAVKEEKREYFWTIEGFDGDDFHEIPKSLFDELVKHHDSGI